MPYELYRLHEECEIWERYPQPNYITNHARTTEGALHKHAVFLGGRIMQNKLCRLFVVAFTIIAIVTESALIISGLMYDKNERIIVGALGLVVVVPLIVSMWDDVRKQNA